MEKKYILAFDQGTTSSRAVLFDRDGKIVGVSQKEFTQIYPKAGWVEHDAMEIWGTQSGVAREVLETMGVRPEEVAAIWNLTRGKVHVTDYSNASRTMIFNIRDLKWDEKILKELGIPKSMLPEVKQSSEVYGYTDEATFGGLGYQ